MQRMMDQGGGEPMMPEGGQEEFPRLNSDEVMAEWPESAREAGEAVVKIMQSDENKVLDFLDNGNDFVQAAASFVVMQITEAEKRIADIPDDLVYGDGGLSDLAMAMLFRIAEDAGIPEASDINAYHAALDACDEMAGYVDPNEEANEPMPDGDEGEMAPPQFDETRAGPPRGKPVMAG